MDASSRPWRPIDSKRPSGDPCEGRDAVATLRGRLARDLEAARARVHDARRRSADGARLRTGGRGCNRRARRLTAVHPGPSSGCATSSTRSCSRLASKTCRPRGRRADASRARPLGRCPRRGRAGRRGSKAGGVRARPRQRLDRERRRVPREPRRSGERGRPAGPRAAIWSSAKARAARLVTRLPASPTLGRRARERRSDDSRAQAAAIAIEIDEAVEAQSRVEALVRDADRLLEEGRALDAGNPAEALVATVASVEAGEAAGVGRDELLLPDGGAPDAKKKAAASRTLVEGFRTLAARRSVLARTSRPRRARKGDLRDAEARDARTRRAEANASAETHAGGCSIELLRVPCAGRRGALLEVGRASGSRSATRASLSRMRGARRGHAATVAPSASRELESALTERGAVASALEAQLAGAREALNAREEGLRGSEASWEAATLAAQKSGEPECDAIDAQLRRLEGDLALGASARCIGVSRSPRQRT